MQRHISTLRTLRKKLEDRNDLKMRSEEYRQWQKSFQPKKNAVMLGKTLAEVEVGYEREVEEDDDINDKLMHASNTRKKGQSMPKQTAGSQELNTVLDSLNRLQELESRITSLEKDNKYDLMMAKEKPTADQRQSFEFKRARAVRAPSGSLPGTKGPVGVVYNVSLPAKGGRGGMGMGVGRKGVPPGRGQGRGPAGHGPSSYEQDDYDGDLDSSERGGGIFITADNTGGGGGGADAKR